MQELGRKRTNNTTTLKRNVILLFTNGKYVVY
jgi:hypothetical protein